MQVQWMRVVRFAAIFFPMALVACSATNSSSTTGSNPITNPPPVNAQTTYSNAALSGTYSFSSGIGEATNTNSLIPVAGTLQFDGNGNITSGTFQYPVPGLPANNPRIYSFTGTYSVSSSASGTATLTFTQLSGNTNQGFNPIIPTGSSFAFTLQAAQQGASVILAESDGLQYISIIALKQ